MRSANVGSMITEVFASKFWHPLLFNFGYQGPTKLIKDLVKGGRGVVGITLEIALNQSFVLNIVHPLGVSREVSTWGVG